MRRTKKPDPAWGSLKDIERWYREERDAKLAQKLNAIRLLMQDKRQVDVAEVLGVSIATVRNWRTRWDKGGREGLKPRYTGSRSIITEDIRADIEKVVEIKKEINGRTITGYLIQGYIKKNSK